MRLNFPKNYFSSFLLSLLGYWTLVQLLMLQITEPERDKFTAEMIALYGEDLTAGWDEGFFYTLQIFLLLLCFLLFSIEFLCKKIFKKFANISTENNCSKTQMQRPSRFIAKILWAGIIIAFYPICKLFIIISWAIIRSF